MDYSNYYTVNHAASWGTSKLILSIKFNTDEDLDKIQKIVVNNASKENFIVILPPLMEELLHKKISCSLKLRGHMLYPNYWIIKLSLYIYKKLYQWKGLKEYKERFKVGPRKINE